MTAEGCTEMHLLIQADVDGELGPAEAARVGTHVDGCADCARLQMQLSGLSGRIRGGATYHAAPAALRNALEARLAASTGPAKPALPARVPWWQGLRRPRWRFAVPFGGGFAVAAGLAMLLLLPRGSELTDSIVADHIRALQPGHLMDVISTDEHTVKPWFDGRLDFAPPVKDLKTDGYPLAGARLDYLDGRPVAALVYHRRLHDIDLYVWPGNGHLGPANTSVNGYNVIHWNQDGMVFWAVSDLGAGELTDFVRLWRAN